MSILYKDNGSGMKVPELYRVTYSSEENWDAVYRWCEKNCKGRFYTSPTWAGQFVEFEDDKDAMWFRLHW